MIWIIQSLLHLDASRRAGEVSEVDHARKLREIVFLAAAIGAEDLSAKLDFMKGVGASISPFLQILAAHFTFLWGLQRSINKGKTAAQLTAFLLRWLPWLALATSQSLGLPALRYLIGTPIGWGLLLVAAVLSFLASLVSRRFIAKVSRIAPDPGLWLSIVAGALRQGVGINRCVGVLRSAAGSPVSQVERELRQAYSAGGSVASRLETAADALREQARADKELAVEKLPIQLLLPLGLFLLPQFLLLLVVPMILASFAGMPTT
jgi:tight adherence protein B